MEYLVIKRGTERIDDKSDKETNNKENQIILNNQKIIFSFLF
jgi:hypothetical protein